MIPDITGGSTISLLREITPAGASALQQYATPGGIWGFLILIAVMVFVALLLYWNTSPSDQEPIPTAPLHGAHENTNTGEVAADDLTMIEGIGPKIAGILHAAGIRTFAGLASTEVSRIQALLDEAGSRYSLADPGSWPEQAEMAAAADWDGLAALQDQLTAGRK